MKTNTSLVLLLPLSLMMLLFINCSKEDGNTFVLEDGQYEVPATDIAKLQLRTAFGTTETLQVVTDDIFAIWWDPRFDHSKDTDEMFALLKSIRTKCLKDLGLADPPNPFMGYYYNIYIHHGPEDLFPEEWGNGQGTDRYRMPYLNLPDGAHLDKLNLFHEGFHIFQYNANSPGYEYNGDSQWFIEATAQWFMATNNLDEEGAFIEAGAITANPQLALWHSFENEAPGDTTDWLYQVRQYGMHTLLYYLTHEAQVNPEIIIDGFYAATNLSPQQYLFNGIGSDSFRKYFTDWAARNTSSFDYLSEAQRDRALEELQHADPNNRHPYALELSGGAVIGTHESPSNLAPRGWAYNVIKLSNLPTGTLRMALEGNSSGSKGATSHFEGRIVAKSESGFTYQEITMADSHTGAQAVLITPETQELFIIVAAVPEHFTGNQTYPYSISISQL
ncbi:MAG: DUF6055 domain-containing protein [Bacteroidota bacterium]